MDIHVRVILDDINMIFVQGFIPRELVAGEVTWFYRNLGIDDTYFQNQSVEVISDHIIALFGAKVVAYTKRDPNNLAIELEKISEEGSGATFIHTSSPDIGGIGSSCEAKYVSYCDASCPIHFSIRPTHTFLLGLTNRSWTNRLPRMRTVWRHSGQRELFLRTLLGNYGAIL